MESDSGHKETLDEKRKRLAALLARHHQHAAHSHPLSVGQRALWYLDRLFPNNPAYNIAVISRLHSANLEVLDSSLRHLVDRHPMLRTTFHVKNGLPVQVIQPAWTSKLNVWQHGQLGNEELKEKAWALAEAPFDLQKGPLFRADWLVGPSANIFVLSVAHIVSDLYSVEQILQEIISFYAAFATGQPVAPATTSASYLDFVSWQTQLLGSEVGESQRIYWENELQGELPTLDLPSDHPRSNLQSFHGQTVEFQVDSEDATQLEQLSKQAGCTLFVTLLAAYEVFLHKLSGQRDILIGFPVLGRPRNAFMATVGFFSNPIVYRGNIEPNIGFLEYLNYVKSKVLNGLAHQDYPFALLADAFAVSRNKNRPPIFQAAFNLNSAQRVSRSAGSMETDWDLIAFSQLGAPFELFLRMFKRDEQLIGAMQFNSELFERSTCERWCRQFSALLHNISTSADSTLSELSLVSQADQHTMLIEWNETHQELDESTTLHGLFEAQALRTPHAVAAEYGDRVWTYQQLDEAAECVAERLNDLGIEPESKIGLLVDRNPFVIVGMLGILRAGACFVPISPDTPSARIQSILAICCAAALVSESAYQPLNTGCSIPVVCIDEIPLVRTSRQGSRPKSPKISGGNLAYAMFTSGSTGMPKGVQIEHRSVVNLLLAAGKLIELNASDVCVSVSNFAFDISIAELFLPLMVGAKVVIVSEEVRKQPNLLARLLDQKLITFMLATPALWRLLIQSNWHGRVGLRAVSTGEELTLSLAQELRPRCDRLWNLYGPTETTIWSCFEEIPFTPAEVTIGRPIANTQVFVLDRLCRATPIGAIGELYISGIGLARGYLNAEGESSQSFTHQTLAHTKNCRVYKTGDLVRYKDDGRLEFLGRRDHQIKINGFRIEPEDIEVCLCRHPAVKQAVVIARTSTDDSKQMIAFLIGNDNDSERPAHSNLRSFIAQFLPRYMQPNAFVWLNQFPLTTTGKLDRSKLPAVSDLRPELGSTYRPPTSDVERVLVEIWGKTLGVELIGIDDNFWDMGGTSIDSVQIAIRMSAYLKKEVSPISLFEFPTISDWIQAYDKASDSSTSTGTLPIELLAVDQSPYSDLITSDSALTRQRCVSHIESLGVYLPSQAVSTQEVLDGCRKRLSPIFERLTGITERRIADPTEGSFELACQAIEECLACSKYEADDIDVVICCSISRLDSQINLALEPNSSMQLKRHFGFKNAIVFDLSNACAGMFTGILVAEDLLAAGSANRILLVSGEFISNIAFTAQKEITGFNDPRMACLTVGDSGAAIILDRRSDDASGFEMLDMLTLSKFSGLCVGRPTDQPHGGFVMHLADPVQMTALAVNRSLAFAAHHLKQFPGLKTPKHLIMHQTSLRALRASEQELMRVFGEEGNVSDRFIINLQNRGNTATTTHFVALWDHVLNGRIRRNDSVAFGISGSGQTIGLAYCELDELPDKLRAYKLQSVRASKQKVAVDVAKLHPHADKRVGIRCAATWSPVVGEREDTVTMCANAVEIMLKRAGVEKDEIGLVLFCGMTRTDHVFEPAIATSVADRLAINPDVDVIGSKRTLAFDVFNSSLGMFNGCHVAMHSLLAGRVRNAIVVAAEVWDVSARELAGQRPIAQMASALLLTCSDSKEVGFGPMAFDYHLQFYESRCTKIDSSSGPPKYKIAISEDWELHLTACIVSSIDAFLKKEHLTIQQIDHLFLPCNVGSFARRLATELSIPLQQIVAADESQALDLFTSALPYAWEQGTMSNRFSKGQVGLIVSIGDGIQVGCALYNF